MYSDLTSRETQEDFDLMDKWLSEIKDEADFDIWWYPRQVESGMIPACEYVKEAIKNERAKMADSNCQFVFDPKPGYIFFKFCRYFYHMKGDKGGTPFILAPWQIWVFAMVLGWKNKEGRYKGKRQYKVVYLEVPRGSGKSAMMGLLGLYMLTCDGEWGPEVYVAATKKDQADLLFKPVMKQLSFSKNRRIIKALKVQRKREYIVSNKDEGGEFKSLSKDGKSFDGMNVHCALVDEIHAHNDSEIWDVLSSGSNKRAQSLMVGITTAGKNFTNFGYQQSSYMKKLLTDPEVRADDQETFACIWTIDKEDDKYDIDTWIKANPSWWTSAINHTKFANSINRTKHWAETKAETYTKLLNVWYQSSDKWLNPDKVMACSHVMPDEDEMKEIPCIVGVDLGYTEDMTALVNVYEKLVEESEGVFRRHYYVYPTYYTPQILVDSGMKPNYQRWVADGQLETVPGETIDYEYIQSELYSRLDSQRILEVGFDRYNANQMMTNIQRIYGRGSVTAINQSMTGLNEASKFFKRLILEERIHFHSEVFTWNCFNAVVRFGVGGLILVDKDPGKPAEKVDGLKACLNALDRFLVRNGETVGDIWDLLD